MELLVGPAFTIDVPSSPAPDGHAGERIFLNGSPEHDGPNFRISGPPKFFTGGESESSSSIGTPEDESDNEEEEVQSKLMIRTGLGSLDALEDSLPIKRGLSNHFDGKSRSFSDLSQVNTLKELKKQESPFNKRRRVLIASKWSRKSAFYSWSNPKSMPLLPVVDEDNNYDYDYEEEEEDKARKVPSSASASASSSSSSSLAEEKKQEEDQVPLRLKRVPESYAAEMTLRLGGFKAKSFSLADLQEHEDEEDDDD